MAVLCYHSTPTDVQHPWWSDFRGQMALIEELGFEVVTLSEAVDLLRKGTPTARPTLAITFDDGWADNLDNAYPELAKRGWPATVFIATSYLGEKEYIPAEGLRDLAGMGIAVENHTHTHRNLTELSASEILDDIHECSQRLFDLTGARPRFFCYPNGRYSAAVRNVVAESGMEAACSARVGFNRPGHDLFLLRRLTLEGGDGPRQLRVRFAGGYDFLDRRQD